MVKTPEKTSGFFVCWALSFLLTLFLAIDANAIYFSGFFIANNNQTISEYCPNEIFARLKNIKIGKSVNKKMHILSLQFPHIFHGN
jgi:hypothetical protein